MRRFDPAKLSALRSGRGWSFEAVARFVTAVLKLEGRVISASTIQSWETGANVPNTNYFLGLCRAFDVPPEELTTTRRARARAAS